MKTTLYLKSLPVVAILLLVAACDSQDLDILNQPQPEQTRIIPFTATAGSGIPTRATLDNSNHYVFQTGDQLYVWGNNAKGSINGVLTLTDGAGSNENAKFSGNLTWNGTGNPEDDNLSLNAVIVSQNDEIFGDPDDFFASVLKEPNYDETSYAYSVEEAVQKFSYFNGTSSYANGNFEFNTNASAFLCFEITLDDGTKAGDNMTAVISNDGSPVRTGTVTAETDPNDSKIKVKFIAGFRGDSYVNLKNATIKLGGRESISFGGTTETPTPLYSNTFYNVKKLYKKDLRYTITASGAGKNIPYSNAPMGYQLTSSEILAALGVSQMESMAKGCAKSKITGDYSNTSVDFDEIQTSPFYKCRFTIVGTGITEFTITTSMGSVVVTINVEEQQN